MDEKNVADAPAPPPAQQGTVSTGSVQVEGVKRPWWHGVKEPGHALQVIIAALLAIGIGMGVSAGVGAENIPEAAPVILNIPGDLWLRALQCVGKSKTPGIRRRREPDRASCSHPHDRVRHDTFC